MNQLVRWLVAGLSSVVIAVLLFLLATVGIVVAFFVLIFLFIFFALALRHQKGSTRVFVYTRPTGENTAVSHGNAGTASGDIHDLSPEEYTIHPVNMKELREDRQK